MPKLNLTELETACEDFSNIIDAKDDCIVYKGTLSSKVEIAVVSIRITSSKDWSKHAETAFQKKVCFLEILVQHFSCHQQLQSIWIFLYRLLCFGCDVD